MKRILAVAVALGLVLAVADGCALKEDPETGEWKIVGFFSWPMFYIYENTTFDQNRLWMPFTTGEPVADATIVVTNNTTNESATLTYYPPDEESTVGFYTVETEFPHTAGQEVSVSITIGDRTFTGGPTVTPDTDLTVTAPSYLAQVEQPFDLVWTESGESDASHVAISVYNWSTDPYVMQAWTVPMTSTSEEITGYDPAASYYFQVYALNRMAITGHGQTYYAWVGSTGYSSSTTVEIIESAGR